MLYSLLNILALERTFGLYNTAAVVFPKSFCSESQQDGLAFDSTCYLNGQFLLVPLCDSVILAMALCRSITSRYCIETAERIKLIFGIVSSSYPRLILHHVIREFGFLQK